jgi:1,4-alpha-glucan branching enzyme
MATAVLERGTLKSVRFQFNAPRAESVRSVALVASFNHWDPSSHRLARSADGAWTLSVMLPPGEYPYFFLVDGVPWNDPEDAGRVPCEWGGSYSLCVVH